MKSASVSLVTLLNGNNVFLMADLLTLTLLGGQTLRLASWDSDLVLGAQTFQAAGGIYPAFTRGKTRVTRGLEVDTLDVSLLCGDSAQLLGIPLPQAAANGALDGARVLLERVFMPTPGDTSPGAVHLFEGAVAGVDPSSTRVKLGVKSELEKLTAQMPSYLYQPGCGHAVYSAGCGLSRIAKTVTGSAGVGATTTSVPSALGQADGYFDLGVLAFTSGACVGARRAVKRWATGAFGLALPLPAVPAPGDTFTVYPGCARTMAACQALGNINRFRGYPFVPPPETAR
jgi:uncharacterized phage protein (TIGR02218 family)